MIRPPSTLDRVIVPLVAATVAATGWIAGGHGFVNGDAAAYAAQGWAGDLGQRSVHLGWTGLAALLAPLAGDALPAWLDRANALFAASITVMVAVWAGWRGGRPWVGAVGAAAAVLAWAPFGEVDVPWVALTLAAIVLAGPWAAAGAFALAVAFSPVALLAAPWAVLARRELEADEQIIPSVRPIAAGGAVAVAVLTLATRGGWWIGDRGLLSTPVPDVLRAAQAWAGNLPMGLVPLAAVAAFVGREGGLLARPASRDVLLACLPLLAAPADTPAFLPLGVTLAMSAAAGWVLAPVEGRPLAAVVLVVQLGLSALRMGAFTIRVAEQDTVSRAVTASLGPDDAMVAPFTWGARVSVLAARDPYALRWRPIGAPLRDQGPRWCARPVDRVAVLPPGTRLGAGSADDHGVWWTRGDDPVFAAWCAPTDAPPAPGG